MEEAYSAFEVAPRRHRIFGPEGAPIKNHFNKELPLLPKKIAGNLCHDLNEIHVKNRDSDFKAAAKKDPAFALLMANGPAGELSESFAYCLISTMMEAGNEDFSFKVEAAIQEGFLFDFLSGTPGKRNPYGVADELWSHFEQVGILLSDYLDVYKRKPLTARIVNHLEHILTEMKPYQRLMVQLLYQFFDNFSVALPILWVSGHLQERHLVAAYWVSRYEQNIEQMETNSESNFEAPKFLMKRMYYLKATARIFDKKSRTLLI